MQASNFKGMIRTGFNNSPSERYTPRARFFFMAFLAILLMDLSSVIFIAVSRREEEKKKEKLIFHLFITGNKKSLSTEGIE